jgi:predicted  nucleic acid-binding Zn-ribbon protein
MSSKIEDVIEKLADQYPNSEHEMTVESFAYWLQKNATPVVELQLNQCDGCRVGIPLEDGNLHAIVNAGGYRDVMVCTAHLYAAPPELAELQAELTRYKSLFEQAQKTIDRVNALHQKKMASTFSELQATIDKLKAENERLQEAHEHVCTNYNKVSYASEERGKEIERLKGGQGEPVAWLNVATGHVTTSPVVVMDWDDEKEQVQSLYTSQPAPVSSELVQLLERAKVYARGPFLDEINACLDKVKELNT